jgi:glutathione S-transferase
MNYQLYNRRGSGGFVVEAALTLADATFTLHLLDTSPGLPLPESFRETNPWRQVPTLVLGDGSVMTETAAILIYLNSVHKDKALGPALGSKTYSQFLRWCVFASVNVYEAVLRVTYPERYTTDLASVMHVRESALQRAAEGLGVIEAAIGTQPFLLGQNMGILDVYLAMLYLWFRGELEAPRLESITEHVRTHPIVSPLWRRDFGAA